MGHWRQGNEEGLSWISMWHAKCGAEKGQYPHTLHIYPPSIETRIFPFVRLVEIIFNFFSFLHFLLCFSKWSFLSWLVPQLRHLCIILVFICFFQEKFKTKKGPKSGPKNDWGITLQFYLVCVHYLHNILVPCFVRYFHSVFSHWLFLEVFKLFKMD